MGDDAATFERLIRLGIALAVGLTVGLERGWRERNAAEGSRIAGWRTFGLFGLTGGLWADLTHSDPIAFGLATGALGIILGIAYWRQESSASRSITTLVAGILTFVLGGLAGSGHLVEAAASAVMVAIQLSAKSELHGWLRRLTERELRAALQFLLIAAVILPLLPDRGYGPYAALNPRQIWTFIVVLAGISFAGYAAMRIWGERIGLMLTAMLGGLFASTAVALNFARRMKKERLSARLLAAGIMAASAVSFLRTLVLVGIFQSAMLPSMAVFIVTAIAVAAAASFILWRKTRPDGQGAALPVGNPLELSQALQLTAILVVVLILSEWLNRQIGDSGLALLSVVTGMVEIDATTISLSRMVDEGLSPRTGSMMLMIGLASNGLLKAAVAFAFGGIALGLRVAVPYLLAVGGGAAIFFAAV